MKDLSGQQYMLVQWMIENNFRLPHFANILFKPCADQVSVLRRNGICNERKKAGTPFYRKAVDRKFV